MSAKSRIYLAFASVLGSLILFSPVAQSAGEQLLGRILYSDGTTLRGLAVPREETILNGDVLATSENGSAIVEFKSGAKLKISENSSVRFLAAADKVQAELLSGAVVSESAGKPTLVVTTPKHQFEPSQEGNCRFAVALSKQQESVASAVMGNLLIRTPGSLGTYILPEGKYAAIPASSAGAPPQEKVGGEPTSAGRAGTVMNEISEVVVQRQGEGAENMLKLADIVNQEDVVRTLKSGRVRIALLDGSFLNFGAGSAMRIIKYDAPMQQTQVELTQGRLRAEVIRLAKPGAIFQVQTQTAAISVVGTVFLVDAQPDFTQVCSVEGVVWVQNIDSAIPGQVTLHAGECTTVRRQLSPAGAVQSSPGQLQSQMAQTNVGPPTAAAGGPTGPGGASSGTWHVGSLSEANSIMLAAGIAAGTAAAIAIPVITSKPASPSAP